jgi:hypothetical protein
MKNCFAKKLFLSIFNCVTRIYYDINQLYKSYTINLHMRVYVRPQKKHKDIL